jgi:hypothetical protein
MKRRAKVKKAEKMQLLRRIKKRPSNQKAKEKKTKIIHIN